jgi:hypothetical protein
MANGYQKFWNLRACLEGIIVNTANIKAVAANSIAVDMANQAAADLTDLYRAWGIRFASQNAASYSIAGYSGPLVPDLGVQGFGYIRRNITETTSYVALLNNLAGQTNFATFSNPSAVEAYYENLWPVLRTELESVATQIGA